MKIDVVTGNAYFREWEKDLSRIHKAGFSCGYIKIMDLATGKIFWQVDAQKGEGPRIVAQMPTLDEAVRELGRLVLLVP